MRQRHRVPFIAAAFIIAALILAVASPVPGGQVPRGPAPVPRCRASQIDLRDEGSDGASGRSYMHVGLRNEGAMTCRLDGSFRLRITQPDGALRLVDSVAVPSDDSVPVVLAPGTAAMVDVSDRRCQPGEPCIVHTRKEIELPGDSTWLAVNAPQRDSVTEIRVSYARFPWASRDLTPSHVALGAAEFRFDVDTVSVKAGGPAVRATVPAHVVIHNASASPLSLAWKRCVVMTTATNSVGGHAVTSRPCGNWIGGVRGGMLPPGLNAGFGLGLLAAPQPCGFIWRVTVDVATDLGVAHFTGGPFDIVNGTPCQPSTRLTGAAIPWSRDTLLGILSAVSAREVGDVAPDTVDVQPPRPGVPSGKVAVFHQGAPIELHFYLENLRDAPATLSLGPAAFRVYIRGPGNTSRHVLPRAGAVPLASPASGLLTIAPHTQRVAGMRLLTSDFDLAPGDYEIIIAPLTLRGSAAGANGTRDPDVWSVEGARSSTLLRILP